MAVKPAQVRQAAEFLRVRRQNSISPQDFARASEELNKSFAETLALITKLLAAGQGQGDFPQTMDAIEKGVV